MTLVPESGVEVATPSTPGRRLRLNTRATIPSVVVIGFLLLGLVAPELVSYDFRYASVVDRLLPPGSVTSTGDTAWFGTDQVGRDVLAQVIQGARVSITVGGLALLLGGAFGALIGMLAGYVGGWFDSLAMRIVDIQMTIPGILLAILLASVIGPSTANVVIVVSLVIWGTFARVARGSTLTLKEREFVQASRMMGASTWHITFRHLLPGVRAPLMVVGTLEFGMAILLEASLSFLGLGTPPATPSWGYTIAQGRDYLDGGWWISTLPGLVLAALMIAVGLLGDALRDLQDPHMSANERPDGT